MSKKVCDDKSCFELKHDFELTRVVSITYSSTLKQISQTSLQTLPVLKETSWC